MSARPLVQMQPFLGTGGVRQSTLCAHLIPRHANLKTGKQAQGSSQWVSDNCETYCLVGSLLLFGHSGSGNLEIHPENYLFHSYLLLLNQGNWDEPVRNQAKGRHVVFRKLAQLFIYPSFPLTVLGLVLYCPT